MDYGETKTAITEHGEQQGRLGDKAKREGRNEDAAKCHARAKVARDEGLLLHGTDEASDPNYSMQHQKLIKSAHDHDLVKHNFRDPTLA
jgi:hypothetical protein